MAKRSTPFRLSAVMRNARFMMASNWLSTAGVAVPLRSGGIGTTSIQGTPPNTS
jgi:hypothetical protein